MSTLIKGVEMPKTGVYILSIDNTGKDKTIFTIAEHTSSGKIIPRHVGEAVSLPPHGELVDIRPLMRGLYEEICTGEVSYTSKEVYEMLERETPTIIEAEVDDG